MADALRLAARGKGRVEPNPMVGCVLVRNGRIIGQGYHKRFGGAHAEVEALRTCDTSPEGCDAYVTLEPCSHFGKTPPCTAALIEAGVARVFAAITDPGPHVRGRGFRQLRRAGVHVEIGLLEREARLQNAPYLKLVREQRPWVILKWAQSIDGKLATRSRRPAAISGERANALVHRWRGAVDGILVGIETALADDPLLTARTARPKRVAARIVLDAQLRLPPRNRLVRTARQAKVLVFCDRKILPSRASRAKELARLGCEILPMPAAKGLVRLDRVLDELGRRNFSNLLVEGGGRVLGSFLDASLADEARVFVSPTLVGGRNAPSALSGAGPHNWPDNLPAEHIQTRRVGRDLLYSIRLCQSAH